MAQFSERNIMVNNYDPKECNIGYGIWSIAQDLNGLMYFGTYDGLIQFDGERWIKLPPYDLVQSVAIGEDNRIFIGMRSDFGYVSLDKNREPKFYSLKHLLPEDASEFGHIWKIASTSQGIYFQSEKYIFKYFNNSLKVFQAENIYFMYGIEDSIYFQKMDKGIFHLKEGTSSLKIDDVIFDNPLVTALRKVGHDSLLIFSQKKFLRKSSCHESVFLFTKGDVHPIALGQAGDYISGIYDGCVLGANIMVLGTLNDGIYFYTITGQKIAHINKENGLKYNAINALFIDRESNIWIGHDKGLSKLKVEPHINKYDDKGALKKLETGIYTSMWSNERLFIGTMSGLFIVHNDVMEKTDLADIQVNSIVKIKGKNISENKILVATSNGIYEIFEDGQVSSNLIEEGIESFCIVQSKSDSSIIYYGEYHGIGVLKLDKQNNIHYKATIKTGNMDIRNVFEDSLGSIWANSYKKGLMRIDVSASKNFHPHSYKIYHNEGVIQANNKIKSFNNQLYISNINGVYKLDFQKPENSLPIYKNKTSSHINDFEFLENNDLIVSINNQLFAESMEITKSPKNLNDKLNFLPKGEIRSITVVDEALWVTQADRIMKIDLLTKENVRGNLVRPVITKITLDNGESPNVIFRLLGDLSNDNKLNQGPNRYTFAYGSHLSFEFSVPSYLNETKIEYCYKLEGKDSRWSSWNKNAKISYDHVPVGENTFYIKARQSNSLYLGSTKLKFTIIPPWYKSTLAYVVYFFLFVMSFILFSELKTEKLKKQNRILGDIIDNNEEKLTRSHDTISKQARSLLTLAKQKNFLLGVIAHDLKNSLNNIFSIVQLFGRNQENLNEKQHGYLSGIQNNTKRLQVMVYNILNIDKIESRMLDLQIKEINITSVLKEVLEVNFFSAVEKRIEIETEITGGTFILGDEKCVFDIFDNLLSNAIKYTPFRGKVRVMLKRKGEVIKFSVKDNGFGIKKQELNQLFKKFTRLSIPTSSESSSGLGLAIVKEYVTAMKGKVWCVSKENKGAEFVVEFPSAREV
ncbi:sensor histidine kinase [Reichenbachiella faecimaris]|nr:ATP-binding protein [Reichenbachiella faecimaris]